MNSIQLFITILLFKSSLINCNFQSSLNDIGDEKAKAEKQQKFPPCKSCTVFVESFVKAMQKTERGKHGGGDADWEEKKLGSYKTSEVRLTEIQEILCSDIRKGEQQCHAIAEEYENEIETWWKLQDENPDFYSWFCIDTMKVCCPIGHFGKECNPCSTCGGNGVCAGNGTRKGNGKCKCEKGYTGVDCQSCADGFYEAFRDESKLLCSPCHISCDGKCSGPGNKNCEKCTDGWLTTEGGGCLDINECTDKKSCPRKSTFCVNNEGSFACLECDRACSSCDGDGPDMCLECNKGYELRDGMCTASAVDAETLSNVGNTKDDDNEEKMPIARSEL